MKLGRKSDGFIPKSDRIVKLPSSLMKWQVLILIMTVIAAIVSELFVFLLEGATSAIDTSVLFALVLFFVYLMRKSITEILTVISSQISIRFEENIRLDVSKKSAAVLTATKGKVKKGNETISSTTILNQVSSYIFEHRRLVLTCLKQIIQMGTFVVAFVGLVVVSIGKFDKTFFLISFACTLVLVVSITVWQVKRNKVFANEQYQAQVQQEMDKNDAININPISKEHMDYMVDNFINSIRRYSRSVQREHLNFSMCNLAKSFCIGAAVVLVILNVVITNGIENITAESFLSFVALAAIYENVLASLSGKITDIQRLINARNSLMNKKALFDTIVDVYNKENFVKEEEFVENTLVVEPFAFSYNEEFTLKNEKSLVFEKGKMTLLKGPSGSGKSTLLGIISGSILTEGNVKYKTVYFSSDRTLGAKNLLREITFENEIDKVDRNRLITILKGVCLFDEFIKKADGEDILVYLSHTYKENLSTGLDQRVMLARTMYRLDDGNIVIIDEPIGALDQETALSVLDFIKQYACKDKLVVVTTHQYYIYDGFDEVIELFKTGRETKITTQA